MSTLQFQGSLLEMPDGDVFRQIDQRMPLAQPADERSIVLTVDSAVAVDLSAIAAVHMLQIEANNPVTVRVTSTAGAAQSVPSEFLFLVSRAVPITGISLVRVAGQTTTVRLTLGQGA